MLTIKNSCVSTVQCLGPYTSDTRGALPPIWGNPFCITTAQLQDIRRIHGCEMFTNTAYMEDVLAIICVARSTTPTSLCVSALETQIIFTQLNSAIPTCISRTYTCSGIRFLPSRDCISEYCTALVAFMQLRSVLVLVLVLVPPVPTAYRYATLLGNNPVVRRWPCVALHLAQFAVRSGVRARSTSSFNTHKKHEHNETTYNTQTQGMQPIARVTRTGGRRRVHKVLSGLDRFPAEQTAISIYNGHIR